MGRKVTEQKGCEKNEYNEGEMQAAILHEHLEKY